MGSGAGGGGAGTSDGLGWTATTTECGGVIGSTETPAVAVCPQHSDRIRFPQNDCANLITAARMAMIVAEAPPALRASRKSI